MALISKTQITPNIEIHVNSDNRQIDTSSEGKTKIAIIAISGIVIIAFLICSVICLHENAQALFLAKELVWEFFTSIFSL